MEYCFFTSQTCTVVLHLVNITFGRTGYDGLQS